MTGPFSPRQRRVMVFAAVCAATAVLASCAHQPAPAHHSVPGFFSGLLHGFLIFFSFVGSLFSDIRIYAFPNSGGWYDFGFLLGASAFLGGGGASTR